ncbi:hypothetical protein HDU67_003567 [Dinochytrium kinnereticum]|nr:hypothetical protein HDU67_003567 [Dinochytrium kinnereticum]
MTAAGDADRDDDGLGGEPREECFPSPRLSMEDEESEMELMEDTESFFERRPSNTFSVQTSYSTISSTSNLSIASTSITETTASSLSLDSASSSIASAPRSSIISSLPGRSTRIFGQVDRPAFTRPSPPPRMITDVKVAPPPGGKGWGGVGKVNQVDGSTRAAVDAVKHRFKIARDSKGFFVPSKARTVTPPPLTPTPPVAALVTPIASSDTLRSTPSSPDRQQDEVRSLSSESQQRGQQRQDISDDNHASHRGEDVVEDLGDDDSTHRRHRYIPSTSSMAPTVGIGGDHRSIGESTSLGNIYPSSPSGLTYDTLEPPYPSLIRQNREPSPPLRTPPLPVKVPLEDRLKPLGPRMLAAPIPPPRGGGRISPDGRHQMLSASNSSTPTPSPYGTLDRVYLTAGKGDMEQGGRAGMATGSRGSGVLRVPPAYLQPRIYFYAILVVVCSAALGCMGVRMKEELNNLKHFSGSIKPISKDPSTAISGMALFVASATFCLFVSLICLVAYFTLGSRMCARDEAPFLILMDFDEMAQSDSNHDDDGSEGERRNPSALFTSHLKKAIHSSRVIPSPWPPVIDISVHSLSLILWICTLSDMLAKIASCASGDCGGDLMKVAIALGFIAGVMIAAAVGKRAWEVIRGRVVRATLARAGLKIGGCGSFRKKSSPL